MSSTRLLILLATLCLPLSLRADPTPPSPTERWTKPYADFHELVGLLQSQLARNYIPEFLLIRGNDTIAILQIDAFAVEVLREADRMLLPYRESIQGCVDRDQNEYRTSKTSSYERFAWMLDSYVRTLVKAVHGEEEPAVVDGVKEKRVVTESSLYALTRLLVAYLEDRANHSKEPEVFATDKRLATTLNDVGRRVLRLDLTKKFDIRELAASQEQALSSSTASGETACTVTLPLTREQVANRN